MSKHVLGIDVSKAELSVTLAYGRKFTHKIFSNCAKGHELLCQWLHKSGLDEIEVYFEATGRYGCEVADALYNAGYAVKIINPLRINSFAKTLLARHKTDKVDSKIIAEYGLQFDSMKYEPLSPERKKLRDLYRCSQDIKIGITNCINHLENANQLPSEVVKLWSDAKERWLCELRKLESLMQQIIDQDACLKRDMENLLSIKGIGITTVMAIFAELPNIQSFKSARQLAAFLGVTPKQTVSGSSVYKRSRISKMGSGILRKALFFPAISAIKHNEYFQSVANALAQRGKAKKSIVCAVMRRLTHVIFGILKHKEKFNAEKLLPPNKNLASAPQIALAR